MSLLSDFKTFCEAMLLRGRALPVEVSKDSNPKSGDILLDYKSGGGKPLIYVIWSGSILDGLNVIPLTLSRQIDGKPMTARIISKINAEIVKLSFDLIKDIKMVNHLLNNEEKKRLRRNGVQHKVVWAYDEKLIDARQKKMEDDARKEEERLKDIGVVTHREPTTDSEKEERVRKMLLGDSDSEQKQETPEEARKRIFGADAVATDKSVASDADRLRQHIAKQNMSDILAARKAAREAGQEVPLSTRRRRF